MSKTRESEEMKPGDLVFVSGTSTGDNPWVVKLYRTRDPVLLLELGGSEEGRWARVLDESEEKYLRPNQLKVIKT